MKHIKKFIEMVKTLINKTIDKITKRNKWKMYLYAQNQCIKKLYIGDEEKPFDNVYVITVLFRKHILGSNIAKLVVKPVRLKYTDNANKQVHIEAKLFEGVEINV